jgi:hypothetical protein
LSVKTLLFALKGFVFSSGCLVWSLFLLYSKLKKNMIARDLPSRVMPQIPVEFTSQCSAATTMFTSAELQFDVVGAWSWSLDVFILYQT